MSQEKHKTYVFFDRTTGAVLGTHAVYDVTAEAYREPSEEEARVALGGLLAGRKPEQIGMMEVDLSQGTNQAGLHVDVSAKKLVPKPRLQIKAERTQIQGDGKDTLKVDIRVVDEAGKAVEGFEGELLVSCARGKLSAPGGRVKAAGGKATITLTSTAETADRVSVRVRDPLGRCVPDATDVEFL